MIFSVMMVRKDQVECNSEENSCYQYHPGGDSGYPKGLIKYNGDYGKRNEDPAERKIYDAVYDDDRHQNSNYKSPYADVRKYRGQIQYIEFPHDKAHSQCDKQNSRKDISCSVFHIISPL